LADSLPGSANRPVDTEPAVTGQELLHSLWNSLVLADHEEPAWQEERRDLLRHAPLHWVCEVGEDQIAAQDEVKREIEMRESPSSNAHSFECVWR